MPHVSFTQLWIPILLSAVCVFIASSLIHMVLKWHASDYSALPNEDEVRAAIRKGTPAPGHLDGQALQQRGQGPGRCPHLRAAQCWRLRLAVAEIRP